MLSNWIQNLSKNYLNCNLLLKSCNSENNGRIIWYNILNKVGGIMSNNDPQNNKLIFENEIIGLSNRIDERFHNNIAYYLNNCCPECGTVLDRKI